MQISLLSNIWDKIGQFLFGFLAFIPQLIYFLFTSAASLLDVLQYLIRKLAGLDVYYVTNADGKAEAQTGDILTKFLKGVLGIEGGSEYSAIKTVFYSMIIFGVILLILSTIVAFIKAHYNYDANKANPGKILGSAMKTVATMVIVPIVTIFGMYILNALLGAVDTITSPASSSVLGDTFSKDAISQFASGYAGGVEENGYRAYASFDYFGAGDFTNNASFSGMIFRVSAQNCNRIRTDDYSYDKGELTDGGNTTSGWSNFGVFTAEGLQGSPTELKEKVASQIDTAFANNLHLADTTHDAWCIGEASLLSTSYMLLSTVWRGGLIHVRSFSKFNVGLVWYYYNLWSFNWLLGFVGIIICVTMLGNIVFGLMTRLLQVIALFLVFPVLVGISPLDEGQGFTTWRKQFMGDILMVVGAVVATNIFFMILPLFNTIKFFNNSFVDGIVNMLMVMAGLSLIKKFISMVSKFAGGSDANEVGQAAKADVGAAAGKAMSPVMKGAGLALTTLKPAMGGIVTSIKQRSAQARRARAAAARQKVRDNPEQTKRNAWRESHAKNLEEKATKQEANAARKMLKKAGLNPDSYIKEKDEKGNATAYDTEALEAAKRLNMLDSKSRQEILNDSKGADGKINLNQLKFNVGLGGETDEDKAKSKKKWADKRDAYIKRKNEKGLKIAQIFGQGDKFKENKLVVDKNGEESIQGSGVFSGIGNAVLDLSQTTLKAFAQMTGASDAWKKLGDLGVVDDAKKALQTIASGMGIDYKHNDYLTGEAGPVKFDIRTEKDKSKQDEKDLKDARKMQNAEIKNLATELKKAAKAMGELSSKLSTPSPTGAGDDEGDKSGKKS